MKLSRTLISLAVASAAAAVSGVAQAHDVYAGLGLPGLYTIGATRNLNDSFNARMSYSGGVDVSKDGTYEGVSATGSLKSSAVGLFGDWYPFSGSGWRLVGGMTFNDTRAELSAAGTGTATINGATVNMAGDYYRVKVAMPSTTPYIGIGYGHHQTNQKGLGFYADLGVMVGGFNVSSETSLVSSGKTTQADINAQDAKIRDSVSSVSYVPVVSLGLVYRY